MELIVKLELLFVATTIGQANMLGYINPASRPLSGRPPGL